MVDITFKSYTLRKAVASASILVSNPETIRMVQERRIPKGDILEFARAAALLAIKKTADLIPDCHPLPLEYAAIRYELTESTIEIEVEVHTIYKTGVEVETMHGASLAALVIYDMLKPIDKGVEIQRIRLLEKKGGKSSFAQDLAPKLKAAVVVCSDRVFQQQATDRSGLLIVENLEKQGFEDIAYQLVPDEKEAIQAQLVAAKEAGVDLLLFTGGTGLSARDVTPEAVSPYITQAIPGIMETARQYGQQRVPTAMLSRGLAGFADNMLVITLPGSPAGVQESMDALFPAVLHVFQLNAGAEPHLSPPQ